jgi:Protein of unknown function (DUF2474)
MPEGSCGRKRWLRRFGWLVFIWIASVGALAITAVSLRLLMNMAGMTV